MENSENQMAEEAASRTWIPLDPNHPDSIMPTAADADPDGMILVKPADSALNTWHFAEAARIALDGLCVGDYWMRPPPWPNSAVGSVEASRKPSLRP